MPCVNASTKLRKIDVGEKGIEEVITETWNLALVETAAGGQVLPRLVKNLDLHFVESRMLGFASTQSMNWEDPSWTRGSRFRRTSACQDGDGTSFGLRQRLSQIASSALSFSAVVIRSSGRATSMGYPPQSDLMALMIPD
jgi:hypothetical protein